VLRFAAGTPEEPYSGVWRLVASKDAYLGCSSAMGLFKISLHEKDTLVGFTRESGAKFESGSRIAQAWPRPPEFQVGWTRGPQIHVPWNSLGARDLMSKDVGADIEWYPPPEVGEVVVFTVLWEAPGDPDGAFLQPRDAVMGSVVERRTGCNVWVIAQRVQGDAEYMRGCEEMLADPTNQFIYDVAPVRPHGALLRVHTGQEGPQPQVTDLPSPHRVRESGT
jgi:hypothetical protein